MADVQVVLCANSGPALNDVTYNELTILARRVADISEDIRTALTEGRLLVMESGQGSPCLDLRYYTLFSIGKESKPQTCTLLDGMDSTMTTE